MIYRQAIARGREKRWNTFTRVYISVKRPIRFFRHRMHFATHPCVSRVPNKVAATTITTTKKKKRSKYKKGKKKNERKKIANIYIYSLEQRHRRLQQQVKKRERDRNTCSCDVCTCYFFFSLSLFDRNVQYYDQLQRDTNWYDKRLTSGWFIC